MSRISGSSQFNEGSIDFGVRRVNAHIQLEFLLSHSRHLYAAQNLQPLHYVIPTTMQQRYPEPITRIADHHPAASLRNHGHRPPNHTRAEKPLSETHQDRGVQEDCP